MKLTVKIQLMVMMFLMFFTWGAWYGQMSKYMLVQLGATGDQIGNAYLAFSIACVVAPFFVGLIADKYFAAQKVMAVINILGGIVLYFLIQVTDPGVFFWYILAYTITFTPNLALSSMIAMNQMKDPEKEFPAIRVLGTIAWIVVSNLIGYYALGDKVDIFKLALFSSVILGAFSFTLPNTPPSGKDDTGMKDIMGIDAFVLFKDRSFLIFFISSILICIPLSFYYALANPSLTDSGMMNVENKMSLGQVSEVVFMLALPFAIKKLGVKKILFVALVAWILRFLCFGYGEVPSSEYILIIAILLHGICYDFFFVTGQIYTDAKAGPKIKNSAQGLITLATYGVGMGIGSKISGKVLDYYQIGEESGKAIYNWTAVWLVPAVIAGVVLIYLYYFLKTKRKLKLQYSYFAINKPFKMLSQFTSEGGHASLKDLGFGFPKDVYSIGRLDHDSEGLLLLTNDNKVKTNLLSPKTKIQKIYAVQVEGQISHQAIKDLENGVEISIKGKKYKTQKAEVAILEFANFWERTPPIRFRAEIPTSWIKIKITEGKNRQVRKMTASVGFPTLRLIRTGFGNYHLGELKPGQIKEIEPKLIEKLFEK